MTTKRQHYHFDLGDSSCGTACEDDPLADRRRKDYEVEDEMEMTPDEETACDCEEED